MGLEGMIILDTWAQNTEGYMGTYEAESKR